MSSPVAEPSPVATRCALLAIVLVASALRLPTLGVQSLWFDEAATWGQVNGTFADIIYRTSADNYPPLYNILAWLAVQGLGDSEWVLRLPAALLGVANVWLLYALGRRIAGPTAGLIAALLLALSGFHLWHSQEARMYTLLAFAATAAGWAAIDAIERAGWRSATLLALAGTALMYSHPYGALTFAGIGLGAVLVVVGRRDWSGLAWLAGAGAVSLVAFVPWAVILLGRANVINHTGFWIESLSLNTFRQALSELSRGMIYALILAVPLLLLWRRRLVPPRIGYAPVLLVAWVIVPIVLGVVISLLLEPVFIHRYLLGILPALLLLIALSAVALTRTKRSRAIMVSLILILGLVTLFYRPLSPRTDWRSAVAEVRSQYQAGDCIGLHRPEHRVTLDYYWRDPDRCTLTEAANPETVAALDLNGKLYVLSDVARNTADRMAARIAAVLPLVETKRYHRMALFVFAADESARRSQ